MLTVAKVTDGEAASNYYENADDYYQEKSSAPSAWWGKGSARAGLSGSVQSDDFRNLLDGNMPDGSKMHHGGEESRRAGTDLTFSAPKSVSLQALIAGDNRLVLAHEAAVSKTVSFIEEKLAAYRLTSDGMTSSVNSENLIVAQFRHDLSRSCDPQLHTHAVVLNATQREDSQWRALDAHALYTNQKLLGAYYRAELALQIRRLGYETRLTHNDGRFELSHITDQHVAAFSTRSGLIEAALKKLGKTRSTSSARQREFAALETREAKHQEDRSILIDAWQEKANGLGLSFIAKPAAILSSEVAIEKIEAAISYAVEHHTEREAVVSRQCVITAALGMATGFGNYEDVEKALSRQITAGKIIQQGESLTTLAAQEMERSILALEIDGRGFMEPILSQMTLPGTGNGKLNEGQQQAVALVISTTNRVIGIQGRAGSGKTTMLKEVRKQAMAAGWKITGLTPSAAAACELEKTGIPASTIANFMARQSKGLGEKSLLVIDEAGMVGTKDMQAVLASVEASGARAVLVGDVNQLKAVQAGMPFYQLQKNGMTVVNMPEIQRQKNKLLKSAVELASEGYVKNSLALIEQSVIEVPYALDRFVAIAKHYSGLPKAEQGETLVVAGLNSARETINTLIRDELGFRGCGANVRILVSKDLTEAQRKSSLSYQAGDVIQANRKYESIGMPAGATATVVEASAGHVTLKLSNGTKVDWRPALMSGVSCFQVTEREFSIGERLRVTANNYGLKLVNGEFLTVTDIDIEQQRLELQKSDGTSVVMKLDAPLHLEHGYCSTVHSAQGKTCENVIIEADARSATANEATYYVAISRARSMVSIYTDDRDLLPFSMGRRNMKELALSLRPNSKATEYSLSL